LRTDSSFIIIMSFFFFRYTLHAIFDDGILSLVDIGRSFGDILGWLAWLVSLLAAAASYYSLLLLLPCVFS
jgi:hypothetical protein